MTYQVRLLPKAKDDFHAMYEYIAKRSPEGADRWVAALESGLEKLKKNPRLCGFAPEDRSFSRGLRQLIFGTRQGLRYRAVYFVEDDQVLVVRLRGPGQPPLRKAEIPAQ